MKTISLAGYEHIRLSHPNAYLAERDGVQVAIVPTWNFDTDEAGEIVYRVVANDEQPKFKAGDTLRHTVTGALFEVVDPLAKMLKLRKGPTANE